MIMFALGTFCPHRTSHAREVALRTPAQDSVNVNRERVGPSGCEGRGNKKQRVGEGEECLGTLISPLEVLTGGWVGLRETGG